MATKFVAYLRVSTTQQGRSGLGLEAQRDTVQQFVAGRGVIIAPEYVEVESGKRNERPELLKALKQCKLTGATLVVAKLDRLSRNAAFLMTMRDSGVQFVAADMPEANTLTIGIMAVMAQHEREMISQRTKAALAASKARGTKLGGKRANSPDVTLYQAQATSAKVAKANALAGELKDTLEALKGEGLSLAAMAQRLNEAGIKSSRGGLWSATTVMRVVNRLA